MEACRNSLRQMDGGHEIQAGRIEQQQLPLIGPAVDGEPDEHTVVLGGTRRVRHE